MYFLHTIIIQYKNKFAKYTIFVIALSSSLVLSNDVNAEKTIEQIKRLEEAGCDVVRVAVPDMIAAQNLGKIKKAILIL